MAKTKKHVINTALHTKDYNGDIRYLVGIEYLNGLESQLIEMQQNEEFSPPNLEGNFNQTPFEAIIQDLKMAKDSWSTFLEQNPDVDQESLGMLTKHFMSLNSHIVKVNTNRIKSRTPRRRHTLYKEAKELLACKSVNEVSDILKKKYNDKISVNSLYTWKKER